MTEDVYNVTRKCDVGYANNAPQEAPKTPLCDMKPGAAPLTESTYRKPKRHTVYLRNQSSFQAAQTVIFL